MVDWSYIFIFLVMVMALYLFIFKGTNMADEYNHFWSKWTHKKRILWFVYCWTGYVIGIVLSVFLVPVVWNENLQPTQWVILGMIGGILLVYWVLVLAHKPKKVA